MLRFVLQTISQCKLVDTRVNLLLRTDVFTVFHCCVQLFSLCNRTCKTQKVCLIIKLSDKICKMAAMREKCNVGKLTSVSTVNK